MNPKPLFIASLMATLLAAMALEGNALSPRPAADTPAESHFVLLLPSHTAGQPIRLHFSFDILSVLCKQIGGKVMRKTEDKHNMTQKMPQQSGNSSKGQQK